MSTDAPQPALVPVSSLRQATWNPRRTSRSRLDALKRAIAADPEFLWMRPILATSDGTVYAGNQRLAAAIELGMTEVPAIVAIVADVPDDLARARAIRDNVHAGEWVEDALADIVAAAEDASSLGLGEAELAWLIERPEAADTEEIRTDHGRYNTPQLIRIVVAAEDASLLERAVLATGCANKAQAIRTILQAYLDQAGQRVGA